MLSPSSLPYFFKFNQPIDHEPLPANFTYPFCYQPHPVAIIAANEIQAKLPQDLSAQGRMYGVLVVKNSANELGYIAAISGTHLEQDASINNMLVPAIFNGFDKNSDFYQGQNEVNSLNEKIQALTSELKYTQAESLLNSENEAARFQIFQLQQAMIARKKQRKLKRAHIAARLSEEHLQNQPNDHQLATQESIQLSRESVFDKKHLLALKKYWQTRVASAEQTVQQNLLALNHLKTARRKLSNRLQKLLFKQYQFLNILGESKNLIDIFQHDNQIKPPAGSGDCAAPKLLHFAFTEQLTPICMAEFWWGAPAKSEIRKHGHFYPACQSKCQPILTHMLKGMAVDKNPLLETPVQKSPLEIVYQDEHLVVVNKPANLLSVPGKHISDSVYTRIKAMFPKATGGLVVHRLDMATSGLLMLSLNERAHKHLQKQFINKEVTKRYQALIDGKLLEMTGVIKLPLITDIHDRPRQKICEQYGKPAETHWQVIGYKGERTKVLLYPITGRTHQLRVHCAHARGLNMPIVGDDLYGYSDSRLHLHAQYLSFSHPITQQKLEFEIECEF